MNAVENEIWATVVALNRLWTVDGQPEKLVDYFAPEMVAITPTDRFRREGRDACVAGWTEFVRATRIRRWVEKNPLILVIGDGRSAVVAYDFHIDYEMGGHLVSMAGRDLMTFDKRDGRWWLVADTFSAMPA
jgi:ketosteroid isomerase-like protein